MCTHNGDTQRHILCAVLVSINIGSTGWLLQAISCISGAFFLWGHMSPVYRVPARDAHLSARNLPFSRFDARQSKHVCPQYFRLTASLFFTPQTAAVLHDYRRKIAGKSPLRIKRSGVWWDRQWSLYYSIEFSADSRGNCWMVIVIERWRLWYRRSWKLLKILRVYGAMREEGASGSSRRDLWGLLRWQSMSGATVASEFVSGGVFILQDILYQDFSVYITFALLRE